MIHALLLTVSLFALGAAGLRVASLAAPDGLERLLAAFALAAGAAVVSALGLGLVGLGGSSPALAVAALGGLFAARALAPAPACPPLVELRAWLADAPRPVVLGCGGAGGIVLAWIAWQLRHPLIGPDALTYHLPIASAWVQNGHPGSVVAVRNGEPFGNYPLTNEVLVAWALGLSRSWAWVSIWSPLLCVAVVIGGWVALRELGVTALVRSLAIVATAVPPLIVGQLGAPYTDIAALAWLACAAALALAARRRPALIYPAVVAAGLCLGTKTTPAVLLLALAVVARQPLRTARRSLLLAAGAAAVAIGGVWSIRDLIDHGSPLWPLLSTPWGDPIPAAFRPLDARFIDHARHLVGAYWRDYFSVLAGSAVLLGSGLVLPLARRSRAALCSAAVAGVSVLAWALAPYTGVVTFGAVGAVANLRYLLPAIAACTVALALASRGAGPRLRCAVLAALVASIVYSLIRSAAFGPLRPSFATLVVAALCGAGAAAAARVWGVSRVAVDRRVAALGLGVACVAGLAVGGHGYVGRFLAADNPPNRSLYSLPALSGARGPIASAPGVYVLLRGDRLQHPLGLIGASESCPAVVGRLSSGPVILGVGSGRLGDCLRGVPPVASDPYETVYASR